MPEIECKPCPFCSKRNTSVHVHLEHERCVVVCRHCLTRGPIGASYRGAIDLWNYRGAELDETPNSGTIPVADGAEGE